MNNHWGTNYRAYQEGATVFRFVLRPHRDADPAKATRLAIGLSQPLLATRAKGAASSAKSRLQLSSNDVVVIAMQPSDDGQACMVRLFGASGQSRRVKLTWSSPEPKQVWLSDTSEQPHEKVNGVVSVPGWAVVTLRAEF